MLRAHSPRAHAAYLDLRRLLEDDAVAEIIGTPQRLVRNGRAYWYDLHRIGSTVRNRYLGEDSPAFEFGSIARVADVDAAIARAFEALRAGDIDQNDLNDILETLERARRAFGGDKD